jgi:hypothetical protein
MAAGDLHGSVQARELEEELTTARTELRTKLECKSRSELQKEARRYGMAANLKSSVIIDGVLFDECDQRILELPYDLATYMECMEAVRLLMKKIGGAKGILDCVMRVEAELSAPAAKVHKGIGKTDKANIQGNANGKIESKANEVVPPPKLLAKTVILPPAVILPPPVKPLASAVYVPIHVGGVLRAMKDVDLQNLFDTKAIIERFYKKRSGKVIGFAKVLLPIDRIDQILSQDFSLSGSKLRLAKWVESPSARPAQVASPAAGKRRSGRRTRSRRIPSADTASLSNGFIKEQANFIAKLVASQARPPSGGPHSRHGEQLYSQIVAAVKTVDVRTKFLETTMREMSRLLELVPYQVARLQNDGSL